MAGKGSAKSANTSVVSKCMDCDIDLNTKQSKSIECDFCHNWYCLKCSRLKQALFNELSKAQDVGVMWNCGHCRIALPGIKDITARLLNLEAKVGEIAKQDKVAPQTDRESIRKMVQEVRKEDDEIEMRKLNIIVHSLKEHESDDVEVCKLADSELVSEILNNTLNLKVDIEQGRVTRLGKKSEDRSRPIRPRPLRLKVKDFETKRRIMNSSKFLKNHETFSSIYITPDLTQAQREEAFNLREEKRRRERNGERNLIIRRGKIVSSQSTADHPYSRNEGAQGQSSRSPGNRDRSLFQ